MLPQSGRPVNFLTRPDPPFTNHASGSALRVQGLLGFISPTTLLNPERLRCYISHRSPGPFRSETAASGFGIPSGNKNAPIRQRQMDVLIEYLKFAPVLVAALIVGHSFFKEVKKYHRQGAPWYKPYLTVPGIIVICALLAPLILWIVKK